MSEEEPHRHREEGHEPQGVVETLREEIEEAVEHVPEPVRWTVGKLTRLVLLVVAGLVVLAIASAILYFMNRTELVARELSLVLNRTLREHSDLVLDLRDIRGNPFMGFRAVEPRVRFRDGTTLLEAPEMRVEYSLLSLVRGQGGALDVTLERPRVRLTDDQGRWRLPVWRSDPSRQRRGGPPRPLQVHLRVPGAEVMGPRPYGLVSGAELDLVADLGPHTRMRLERLRWAKGPWDSRLDRLAADLRADSSGVRIRVNEVLSRDLELRGELGWAAGDPVRQVRASVGRVNWTWLARVFANRTSDVAGEGSFVFEGSGEREWRGRFATTLEWDGLAAEGTGRLHWDGEALALDSVAARSRAGDLLGRVRWTREGWEVEADAQRADPSQWQFLKLTGWPAGDLNGWFRYRALTKGRPSGELDARLASSLWQGWRIDSAGVRVDFPAVAQDSFRVVGVRRGGRFTLHGRTDARGGWSGPWTVRDLPLDEWPDGRATGLTGRLDRGEGTAEGRSGTLFVTGTLAGSRTRWASANFARWTLDGVRGRLSPTPELSARAEAEDGFFLGLHLDHAAAPLLLGDQVVRFMPLTAQAGDTTLAATGQAAWGGATWWTTLSSAEVMSDQFHFVAEPPVRLTGDPNGVVFERLAANDRDAHVEASGRWASPGGPYDFELKAAALDLARVGYPRDWGLGGRASLRLRVQGRSGDPRWRFEGRAGRPRYGGQSADSISLVL